ncbi:1-deoxy-D-xylulose 5-phosphate reductoisomerase [Verrucomicrobiota bacterium]|jgi:1-deoxy-D-xylulose-5-phosphate reductoisomerase|nr:1-deoxy-D-xylulose 5-phosphate reductoisomerase [Verrucomicrobiota bacterium]
MESRPIAILGATGSIGTTTLAVVRAHPTLLRVAGLAAHTRWRELIGPVKEFQVKTIALADPAAAAAARASGEFPGVRILEGTAGLTEVACLPEVHTVVSAVVGTAGLAPTLAALQARKHVALASKELLVLAGKFVTAAARAAGTTLLPVDSEHNAIHQLLRGKDRTEIARLVLTASGGAFRDTPLAELARVTVAQALQHPNWNMGPKVTIDSATMANKGLEVIEARWLFDLPESRIDVVVHPQSIIHSLVTLSDGSLQAQLSPPHMAYPIQDCLLFPQRLPCPAPQLNLAEALALTMSPPDPARYPCLGLARAAAVAGGTAPAIFNAANEVAVEAFVAGALPFTGIAELVQQTLASVGAREPSSLADVLAADGEARRTASRLAPGLAH